MKITNLSMLFRIDWILILAIFGLVIIGLVSIYSSGIAKNDLLNFQKQIIFFVAGIIFLAFFSLLDYRFFKTNRTMLILAYIFSILLLAGLFFFAPQIRGTRTWYDLGVVALDPVEIAKIVLIILLAKFFSARHIELYKSEHIAISGLYALLPAFLILMQPNIGSAFLLMAVWFGVLLISGIRMRHFLFLVMILVLVLALSWQFVLRDYQKERIVSFFVPNQDPLGADWQKLQAKIAIGSGGLFGAGIGRGPQTQHGFLPETETDFIFASIAEEAGFLGIFIIFGLFGLIFWRILRIALVSNSNFPRFFAAGLAISIIIQVIVNIGMNLGVLPVVGISLPFVSYGGSNLIVNLASIGILQSIFLRAQRYD